MKNYQDPSGFVVELGAADEAGLGLVGGKALNLGVLTRAGLPVPEGFCVTTLAYRRVTAGALDPIIDHIDTLDDPGDARARVLAAPVPPDVARAVTEAYRRLGDDVPVAVRSSATAEDLPFASFAGQQDTYLNVVGVDAVLEAVHRCWASLWTDRAVAYRRDNGIDHRGVELAVVVQRMVDAAVAGVMFTANPVTGSRTETVVDASPGLGEAVVSGAVNPDHFVVDGDSGRVVQRRLGDKRVSIRAVPGGGTERRTRAAPDDDGGGSACLTDGQLGELVALGRRVTQLYGAPQDTEWALDEAGSFWLTQARPITTLYPLPDRSGVADGTRAYFCFSLAQGLHRPLTPMGMSALRVIGSSAAEVWGFGVAEPLAGPPVVRDAGGRMFIDVTTILRSDVGRALAPRVLDVMEARSAVVMRRLFDDPRFSVRHRARRAAAATVLRAAVRYRVPVVVAQALVSPAAAHRRLAAIEAESRGRVEPGESATAAERLAFVVELLGHSLVPVFPRVMPVAAAGFAMLAWARALLGADASADELQGVLRSLPDNVTTEMDLELWRLATRVRADTASAGVLGAGSASALAAAHRDGDLPPVLQRELTAFAARYGHRAVAEIDVGMPRWSEDLTHLVSVLQNYLRVDDPDRAPETVFARGAANAEQVVADLTARARARGRLRGWAVGVGLRRARQFAGVRELPKYLLVLMLAAARRQVRAIGAELVAAGALQAPDDVFFLDLREVERAVSGPPPQELAALVTERREAYEREIRRRHVPRIMLSDGTDVEALAEPRSDGTALLVGTPASAGVVTGKARVVLDPVGAHLSPGEILVAPSTDPGWTPLFLTAGGLVMEMGGANSHGAVVAREYGIPAVVGVPDATSTLVTGQEITVDGSSGRVR